MFMFGHDSNLLSLGYYFGGHDEMRDQDNDFYYFVDRLSFSLEVNSENFFLHTLKKQSPNPSYYPTSIYFIMRKNDEEIFPILCGF